MDDPKFTKGALGCYNWKCTLISGLTLTKLSDQIPICEKTEACMGKIYFMLRVEDLIK